MADPFALIARAQRRQGLVEEAEAVAMSGMRLHPQSREIARELTLCFVDLGRYEEALPVSQVAINGFPDDVELLLAYGRLWEPVDPKLAQWAFYRAMDNDPASEEAKRAFDSLRYPLKGAGRSSYAIEMQPTVAEAYHAMLARVRKVAPKLMKLPLLLASVPPGCRSTHPLRRPPVGPPAVHRPHRWHLPLHCSPGRYVQPDPAARRAPDRRAYEHPVA